jgi:hypothetical protein
MIFLLCIISISILNKTWIKSKIDHVQNNGEMKTTYSKAQSKMDN